MIDFMRRVNWQERLYQYQWWLVAAIALVTAALCNALLLGPVWQHYREAVDEANRHQDELQAANAGYTAALGARRLWDHMITHFGKEFLTAQTPDGRDLVVLTYFSHVQEIAGDVGVTLDDINQVPGEGEGGGGDEKSPAISEQHVSIHVRGAYDQLSSFTRQLSESSRVTRVDQAVMTTDDKGTGDNLQLDLKVSLLFYTP